jgi:hypothetical protein
MKVGSTPIGPSIKTIIPHNCAQPAAQIFGSPFWEIRNRDGNAISVFRVAWVEEPASISTQPGTCGSFVVFQTQGNSKYTR